MSEGGKEGGRRKREGIRGKGRISSCLLFHRSLRQCGRTGHSLSPGGGAGEGGGEDDPKLELLLPSMVVRGTIEFKMDKKSYRMIPLANSEDYLYNMAALTKAKQVRGHHTGAQVGLVKGRRMLILQCSDSKLMFLLTITISQ